MCFNVQHSMINTQCSWSLKPRPTRHNLTGCTTSYYTLTSRPATCHAPPPKTPLANPHPRHLSRPHWPLWAGGELREGVRGEAALYAPAERGGAVLHLGKHGE